MPRSTIPPLDGRFPIVDPKTGAPSLQFQRIWQDLFGNEAGTYHVATDTAATSVPQTRKINTTTPIQGGGDLTADLNLSHNVSGVTAGSYTNANITVDADGHVTSAGNGSGGAGAWYWAPPPAAGFTLVSGDATNLAIADDTDVGTALSFNSAAVLGDICRLALEPITTPAAAWSYQVKMAATTFAANFAGAGLVIRNTANNKHIVLMLTTDNNIVVQRRTLTSFSATIRSDFSSSTLYLAEMIFANLFWKVTYDGAGTLSFYHSPDGKKWVSFITEAVATYLTAAPDKIGFGFFSANAGATDDLALSVSRRVKSW